MENKKGFTLIELLVVIAIIALLLSIILPALRKVKEQAKTVVCTSNCRQWMSAIQMYLNDNGGDFWYDGPGAHGFWMELLGKYTGEMNDFRLCPAASIRDWDSIDIANGFKHGSAFQPWDAEAKFSGGAEANYGSYGINLWISPAISASLPGWGFTTDLEKNKKAHWGDAMASNSANIPVLGDCAWFGAEPQDLSTGGRKGQIPAVPDYIFGSQTELRCQLD